MKRILTGIFIAAILTSGTLFVTAQTFGDKTGLDSIFADGKGLRGQLAQRILNIAADRLDLTDEQRAEIRLILEEAAPRVAALLVQAKAVHEQLKPLGRDGVYNQTQVQQLAALQATNARLLIIEKEKIKADIFGVLTEKQRSAASEMQEQFEDQIRQRISSRIGMKF